MSLCVWYGVRIASYLFFCSLVHQYAGALPAAAASRGGGCSSSEVEEGAPLTMTISR